MLIKHFVLVREQDPKGDGFVDNDSTKEYHTINNTEYSSNELLQALIEGYDFAKQVETRELVLERDNL